VDSKSKDGPSINDPAIRNQIRVALKTLKMPSAMLGVMGGMTKEEARKILMKYGIKFEDSKMKDDRSDERKYCSHCKKLVEVEGGLDRQGIYNKCMECGATIDSKTKDGNLDDMIKKMAREKADVPYNDDGTIRTPQQAQLAYERWYKIIKSRYKMILGMLPNMLTQRLGSVRIVRIS